MYRLEDPFRTRDAGFAVVLLDRHSKCSGQPFKDCFTDMVAVATIPQVDVKVARQIARGGLPEVVDEFGVEVSNFLGGEIDIEHPESSSAEIDCGIDQRFFHRKNKKTVPANALLIPQGFPKNLPQTNANVFNRVMLVDVQITLSLNLEIEFPVLRKKIEHVVEKTDTC